MSNLSMDQLAVKVMAMAKKKSIFSLRGYRSTQNLIM